MGAIYALDTPEAVSGAGTGDRGDGGGGLLPCPPYGDACFGPAGMTHTAGDPPPADAVMRTPPGTGSTRKRQP